MPSLPQLQIVLLLALVALAIAAPSTGNRIQKRSFKVARVPNPNYKGRTPGAGTRALIKAHRKFKFDLPQGLLDSMKQSGAGAAVGGAGGALGAVTAALESPETMQQDAASKPLPASENPKLASNGTTVGHAKASGTAPAGARGTGTGSGKVKATPLNGDVEYVSPISIGGQMIDMDFDSGSSDLWVFSTALPPASVGNHTAYDAKKSTSFKAMEGSTFTISYGDGSGASGTVGFDTVDIGGATVPNQAVGMANKVSQSFTEDTGSNGLVGLAYSKLNTVKPTKQKTFFDNAIPDLNEPVFTADLRKNAVGAYEFGTIDSTKFNGSLSWAPVNTTNGFWQFTSSKFAVGDQPATEIPGNPQAIADTGTTLMLVNPGIVNAYYSRVTGAVNNPQVGGVVFPCNAVLPDLKVAVGDNYMAVVRGDDINFAPIEQGSTTCFGGVQAIQSNLQIYGDIMFKSQFVAFNGGNNSIGMAPHQ